MPIILIGAVGGVMSGGILGMFFGATFLAAGYQVSMPRVEEESNQLSEITDNSKPKSGLGRIE